MSKILSYILKKVGISNEVKEARKNGVVIGDNCKLYSVNLDYGHGYLIEIGNNCIITHCTILAHDASTKLFVNKTKVGKVIIGDNCFIGMGSIILPNVTIGNNCIIGAGTIVSKNIPDNSVVVGNPCKIIKKTTEFINEHKEGMKTKPVFDTYWKNKTILQKQEEKEKLKDNFGYDE